MENKLLSSPIQRNRKSIPMSPLRRATIVSSPLVQSINDDDAERSRRRSNVEMQRRISNIGALNRSLNVSQEEEILSNSMLQDHYQTCIKLYAENKINIKNAWSLHIIDCMKSLINNQNIKSGEKFQMATTSLDISSKVYGLRVDNVHEAILKLASSMASMNTNEAKDSENKHDESAMQNDQENEDPNAQEKTKANKKKKKRKNIGEKCVTIVENTKTIEGNIIPHNTAMNSAITNNCLATMEMNTCLKYGAENFVGKRCNIPYWCEVSETHEATSILVVLDYNINLSSSICPSFADFNIDQWNPDEEEQLYNRYDEDITPSSDIVYDENGMPIPELDKSIQDSSNDADCQMDNVEEFGVCQAGEHNEVAYITDMRPGDGPFNSSLQYSYRAAPLVSERYAITGVWAGPLHWKIKSLRRRPAPHAGGSVLETAQRRKRAAANRPEPHPLVLDGVESDDETDVKPSYSHKTIWRRSSGRRYDKVTLPEYFDVTRDDCYTFMLWPWKRAKVQGNFNNCPGQDEQKKTRTEINLNISNYQYDNPNDADYCSQVNDDDVNDYADEPNHDNNEIETDLDTGDFTGDNMVKQPDIVPQTFVSYATHAKKVDMRRLKNVIWHDIVHVPMNEEINEDRVKVQNENFDKVYGRALVKLPSKMAQECTRHLAFVALLHLANEKRLNLTNDIQTGHIIISTADLQSILNRQ